MTKLPKVAHFLTLSDYSASQVQSLVTRSIAIKAEVQQDKPMPRFLEGKTLALLFTKRSTRTRVSSETGWASYGGYPLFLGQADIQMGDGEPIDVTSRVISSMCDCIMARLGDHEEITTLAKHSSVPVINALTAKFHPLQILADLATIQEKYGSKKIKVAWVGDSNNILNSMLLTYPRLGYPLSVATPKGYPVDTSLIAQGAPVELFHDPVEACRDAQVIMTDTWISMGESSDASQKKRDFDSFQVTERLARLAKKDWTFMHCLPRKPHEVDDEVFNGPRSLIYTQAEYRKYSVM
ncbi:ornithine carbamoyltransferase, partial [Kappamyces sp. JEL0680]